MSETTDRPQPEHWLNSRYSPHIVTWGLAGSVSTVAGVIAASLFIAVAVLVVVLVLAALVSLTL